MSILAVIGGALAACLKVGGAVARVLNVANLAVGALNFLGSAFVSLGKSLGIIKEDAKVDELGDKALQAEEAGIKPENFKSYDEYMKKIEEYKLDPDKSKKISEEAKLSKGIEITSALSAEKFPDFPWEKFATTLITNQNIREFFNIDRMSAFGTVLKDTPNTAKDIFNYLIGSEHNEKKIESSLNVLKNIEKSINPEISNADAMANILGARKNN